MSSSPSALEKSPTCVAPTACLVLVSIDDGQSIGVEYPYRWVAISPSVVECDVIVFPDSGYRDDVLSRNFGNVNLPVKFHFHFTCAEDRCNWFLHTVKSCAKPHSNRSRTFSEFKLHISRTRIGAAAWKKRPKIVDVELNPPVFARQCLFTFEMSLEIFTRTWVWGLVLRVCARSVRVWNVRVTSSACIYQLLWWVRALCALKQR